MLKYLIQLPLEVLGQNMLVFLELINIIQWENAAASHESQQLLKAILPYCPPLAVISRKHFELNHEVINWFTKRSCRIQHIKISLDLLNETKFEQFLADEIELSVDKKLVLNDTRRLEHSCINQRISSVNISDDQDPAVMEVFFSLLSNKSSVRRLYIRPNNIYSNYTTNLFKWMEHIRNIGAGLRGLHNQVFLYQFLNGVPIWRN